MHGKLYRRHHALRPAQRRATWDIERCRTPELGGRVERCDRCGKQHLLWNSCNNPHCPTCGSLKRAAWLDARQADLLPVGYFHVVFTLDHDVLPLFAENHEAAYNALFSAAASTLKSFASEKGGLLGITAVLHTWDQQLRLHPHIHCLIPAGMLSMDHEQWLRIRSKFLFPVKALSKVFKARFLDHTARLLRRKELLLPGFLTQREATEILRLSRHRPWVVYSQAPVGGPDAVLKYLARYAYRTAISNQRIIGVTDTEVTFTYKDRAHGNGIKNASLPAQEFLERFLSHILPSGFRRIRHFGFLANSSRRTLLARCFELLSQPAPSRPVTQKTAHTRMLELTGIDISRCKACGVGTLRITQWLQPPHLADARTIFPRPEALNSS